jgi:hypothetical protein
MTNNAQTAVRILVVIAATALVIALAAFQFWAMTDIGRTFQAEEEVQGQAEDACLEVAGQDYGGCVRQELRKLRR